MEYGLVRLLSGRQAFIAITADEYGAIRRAMSGLLEGLFVEEKFDLVVENYLEFETTLLESVVRDMILRGHDYRSLQLQRGLFNRRLANLLSAARIYVDHTKQHIAHIFAEAADEAPDIDAAFSREYDRRPGYRCMEALRNFVQHCGFPVHAMTFERRRVEREGKRLMLFAVTPYLRPDDLRANGSFKKSVLDEMDALGDKIDLKALVREYVEGLSSAHAELRQHIHPKLQEWENVLAEAIDRFRRSSPDDDALSGLTAVARDTDGRYEDQVPVFTEFVDQRKYFEGKNHVVANLTLRFATSEVISKRKT